MASIGKKILSAFVEITEEEPSAVTPKNTVKTETVLPAAAAGKAPDNRFKEYFEKLFKEANIPGPDYYEFAAMTAAMLQSIADERARFSAAFAGLCVQGLSRQQLLSSAGEYLQILDNDASNFSSTIDMALQEKVVLKKKEMEETEQRMAALLKEAETLRGNTERLAAEIKANEEKIAGNSGAYRQALEEMKEKIRCDIEKIKNYIPA